MNFQQNNFEKFVSLVSQHAKQEGINYTGLDGVGTWKASTPQDRHPVIDLPAIWIVAQGRKLCYLGDQSYDFCAGNVVVMFYPMAAEFEVVDASPDHPYLVAGVIIDLGRMADVLLRIDRIDGAAPKPASIDPSGVISIPLTDDLLDPFVRLFTVLAAPRDAAFLGQSIIDEVYFRLLSDARGGKLRYLLQQRGEIQRISKAVAYIHQNLDRPVSVEELAEMVHMGQTSFYENFRRVMHMSPLQYAKSVKLDRAQMLIREGKKANEAGYLVGYNSPAQFSREYKRHFGFAPSATVETYSYPQILT